MQSAHSTFGGISFHGNVGTGVAENVDQRGLFSSEANKPAKKNKVAVTPDGRPRVLVFSAKYHEFDMAERCAREVGKSFSEEDSPFRHYVSITATCELVFVSIDTQGPMFAASFVAAALSYFRPSHVTMIGCCGGRKVSALGAESNLLSVIAFETAIVLDSSGKQLTKSCDPGMQCQEDWSKRLQFPFKVERGQMFTSDKIVEEPEAILEKYNCDGLDMETAAVYLAVNDYNKIHHQARIAKLPIFKGISDNGGGKEQRDENKGQATLNASKVMASHVEHHVKAL